MESEFNLNDLVQEAQYRWLKPAEVLLILQNHEKYQLMDAPPQKPTSGSLFLFNKRVTRFFRKDGHSWRKKKAGRTVREGHERLKVGNVEALNCYYAHGEHNPNFQRRSFWMLDPAYEHIVLVQYREITEGKQSAGSVYLSPDCSSALSTSIYTAENQDSISAISEPYQNSSFSPVSMEFNPELLGGNNVVNYMGDMDRTDLTTSSAPNVSQALGRIEAQLSLKGDELLEVFSYNEENKRPKDSGGESYTRISNQDEILALQASDVRQSQQFSGGNVGFSNHSNSSIRLPHPGGCTIESKEVPCWKPLSEQSSGSCWIDPQDEIFNTLDQIVKPLSFSDMRDISANLAEQQENWTSPWQVSSELENNTKYPNNFFTTVQNSIEPQLSEAKQFRSGSDNMLSPSGISLLQEVEHSNVSAHPSGTGTHEAVNNCYVGRINQVEASLGADSRFTLAHKLRFRIQEISPGWGYATEETKVIIVGSFLCNPSDCIWMCMFGEVEVPLQIIQEGVLCCQAPPHVPGKVALCITSSDRKFCSEVREFEYRSKPVICDNNSSLPKDTSTYTELLLLVRLVQMLLCEPLVLKDDTLKSVNIPGRPKEDADRWEHIIETLLIGTDDQLSTKDWLLQELLRDKLQHWFSTKYKDGDTSDCNLTKKEQGIIHLVAGLGFEWALDPILKCGVGVNYRDINGWTALHWAAHFGREKMVAALIAAGASAGAVTDPTSQDPVGKTAGSIAAAKGHRGIAAYLSEKELTSQLSSLALDKSETSNGTLGVEVDKTVESIPKECLNSIDNQHLLKESLAAVRNSAEAAAHIQSFFRALSYKRRQQKEAAAACCDEYGITPDELSAASKLAFNRFHDHMLNKAAMSIQKKYRGRKARQEFVALRQKIVMIQAHVRGYQVRKRYKVILWAVGILDKVILRWCRKRVGLRGFQSDLASVDESEYEDILKVFRKLKVDHAIDEALSRVLSMVESPEARQQYRRILENYWEAKADLCDNASEAPSTSQVVGENR